MTEEQVFLALLDLPDAARAAYLNEQCGVDGEFRRQVEALLASHFKSGEFLNVPAAEQIGTDSGNLNTVVLPRDAMSADPHDGDEPDALHFLTPSTRPDSLGRIGHYEVLEVLGKGGFGTVLRAFDDVLQRVVAIKVLAPELAVTSPARKRFLREAQSSAKVRHENVVQVYETQEKPLPYLVMEFIPGETLQQRLDRTGPLETREVVQLGRQIAAGLAAAHATGLIHRDVKPGNILIEAGPSERVKLTDFGLARTADEASLTQSGVVAGTPTFMAPEQARGESLDHRADLFSLGSVLYTMCSGRPPFRAATTFAVLKRVVEDEPRPIRELIPETPEWLCGIIARLHAKDPAARFQSAREVSELLADCEAKLKAQRQIETILPTPAAEKPTRAEPHSDPEMRPLMVPTGIRWPLIIATGIMFLATALLLVITESTGLTHIFRGSGVADVTPPPVPLQPDLADEFQAGQWTPLFNGQNLDGWMPNSDLPGNWRVEEGILIGAGPSPLGLLHTVRSDYGDFHLRAEVLIDSEEADGGIFFRALPQGSNELNFCFDPQQPAQRTGSLVVHKPSTKDSLWNSAPPGLAKAKEWMTVEIIVRGSQAVTKVNGVAAAASHDLCGNPRGKIMLQHLGPRTVVRFRKIEIKELPPSDASRGELAKRRFGSDEWIDVIPLIDPALDKWNVPQRTGKNAWRKEQGELVVGGDTLASKLVLPLDSDWPAFECELDFTRRAGNSGLNLNIPTKQGECPLVLDPAGKGGAFLGSTMKGVPLKEGANFVTGERAQLRAIVRRQQDADHVSVALNGAPIGEWAGDKSAIAYSYQEGFPNDRRLSLWIQSGGNEFVFHRIRVRMLDGGTAETLRPVPPASPAAAAETGWMPLFNGQNTIGWKLHPNQGGGWHVLGGEMIGQGAPVNHLFTDRGDYEDFHLRAKVKLDADTMAAVCLRTEFGLSDMDKYPRGYAVLLQNYGEIRTGSLLGLTDFKEPLVKHGEWFTLEVIARGPQLTVKVNGQTTADFADSQHAYRRGHIALRAIGPPQHGGVYVEKIEIKELPATADSKLVKLRSFTPGKDKLPIALRPNGKKVVTVEGDSWRIENSGQQGNFHVMIAQVLDDVPQDGVLSFRAKVRVETKHELAWGSLAFGAANHRFQDWDQWPDALAYYDAQDTEWAEKEIRHPVAECRKSDPPAIYLYAGFHADGVIWLKDVELLHLPAATAAPPPE